MFKIKRWLTFEEEICIVVLIHVQWLNWRWEKTPLVGSLMSDDVSFQVQEYVDVIGASSVIFIILPSFFSIPMVAVAGVAQVGKNRVSFAELDCAYWYVSLFRPLLCIFCLSIDPSTHSSSGNKVTNIINLR